MNSITQNLRFTVSDDVNPDCPTYILWSVYDQGERISVDRLAAAANQLHRQLIELQQQLDALTADPPAVFATGGNHVQV